MTEFGGPRAGNCRHEGVLASMFQQMGLANPQQQAASLTIGGIGSLFCHSKTYGDKLGNLGLTHQEEDDIVVFLMTVTEGHRCVGRGGRR